MAMNVKAFACLLAVSLTALAGCSSLDDRDRKTEDVVAVTVASFIVDPLLPTWWVDDAKIGADRFRITLTKKRFSTGGDGEAPQLFQRRAEALARESGSGRYRVVEFSESVESRTLIARRVAQGVVEILP